MNFFKRMKRKLILVLLFLISLTSSTAQNINGTPGKKQRLYIGADAGISFGSSTLKSFGLDKTRVGFGFGLLGGYHLNHFISAEAELSYHHLGLGAYDCCQNLWLSSNGNSYFAPVADTNNWQFKDLKSSVNLYGIAARVNVNFISMFDIAGRWSVLLSPAIYGMGSSAKIITISLDQQISENSGFHFGIGSDLGVGYQVTQKMNFRLYSGVIYLTGKKMDGMPQIHHKSNYTWNSGLKVTFAID